jgi:hypothetical protein
MKHFTLPLAFQLLVLEPFLLSIGLKLHAETHKTDGVLVAVRYTGSGIDTMLHRRRCKLCSILAPFPN